MHIQQKQTFEFQQRRNCHDEVTKSSNTVNRRLNFVADELHTSTITLPRRASHMMPQGEKSQESGPNDYSNYYHHQKGMENHSHLLGSKAQLSNGSGGHKPSLVFGRSDVGGSTRVSNSNPFEISKNPHAGEAIPSWGGISSDCYTNSNHSSASDLYSMGSHLTDPISNCNLV